MVLSPGRVEFNPYFNQRKLRPRVWEVLVSVSQLVREVRLEL